MAKGRHQKDKLWLIHNELTSSSKTDKSSKLESATFQHCALSHRQFGPESEIVADSNGRLYLKDVAETWSAEYTCNPLSGSTLEAWIPVKMTWSESGEMICPLTSKTLTPLLKIILNKNNGYIYSQNGLKNLTNSKQKIMEDPMDCSEVYPATDLICVHDPEKRDNGSKQTLTREFLQAHKRVAGPTSDESRTIVRGTGLTKRILQRVANEGGSYELATKKLKLNTDADDGYVDPVTGQKKLVRSKVHTSGIARAALTSTTTEPEFEKSFRYLTSREYRSIVYQRMRSRRRVNSELAVTLSLQDPVTKIKFNLNTTYYAWRFPELVHQIAINVLKKSVKVLRVANEFNESDQKGARDTLWFLYEAAFDDVDDEIEMIEKYRSREPFIAAGTIFRRLDTPNAIGITALGFPRDVGTSEVDTLHTIGRVDDPKTLTEIVRAAKEYLTRDFVVHANPYIECEKLAIDEYSAR